MKNYLLVYQGGWPASKSEASQSRNRWRRWFTRISDNLVDEGHLVKKGKFGDFSGYSVIRADSRLQASKISESCPITDEGGSVSLVDTIELDD